MSDSSGEETQQRRSSWGLGVLALAIFGGVLALRVMLILSGQAPADAAECELGLLARSVAAGAERPLYLPGHTHGAGAGLEANLLSYPFYYLGSSAVGLKLFGLALWSALALLAWRLGRAAFGPRAGFITLLLVSVAPQAALWSMKARGGHMSSLALLMGAGLLMWKAFDDQERPLLVKAFVVALGAGVLAVFSAWCHPVATAAALAFLGYFTVALALRSKWTALAGLFVGAGLAVMLVYVYYQPSADTLVAQLAPTTPPPGSFPSWLAGTFIGFFIPYLDYGLSRIPELDVALLGVFAVVVFLWGAFFSMSLIWMMANLDASGERNGRVGNLFLLMVILVTTVVVVAVAGGRLSPRHLLALYPFSCLLMARILAVMGEDYPYRSWFFLLLLVGSGLLASVSPILETRFYNPGSPEGLSFASTAGALRSLEAHGVGHVFCADDEFGWNLSFASNEAVVARPFDPREGHPKHVAAVNRAALTGKPTAVVIVHPDRPDRRLLLEQLDEDPHEHIAYTAPDVVIVYGVPKDYVFLYFPHKIPARDKPRD